VRIVIDAFQVSPILTGTDRLAHNIVREIAKIDHVNDYLIVTNSNVPTFVSAQLPANFSILRVRTRNHFLWLQLRLPTLLRRTNADVFYSFHNFAGPSRSKARMVCSTLDTIPFRRPDLYFGESSPIKRFVVTATMRRVGRRADAVIAISDFTKRDVVELLDIDPRQITVIPLQADPRFFAEPTSDELNRVQELYSLPESFVFALGGSDPRKNLERLVQAYQGLHPDHRAAAPLVLGGAPWHQCLYEPDAPDIRSIGYIEDADLPAVFRLATVFALPSLSEGFGLTVLEAMASDTAVVASNTTSIPEVAGNAAVLFDPNDVESIRSALCVMLEDPAIRTRMIEAGRAQCQKYSWERAATLTLQVLTDTT
jgi:glycosyltransferase involved in cell wall biosynthesis